MKLRDIMTRDVLTLAPGQTASDAFALMRDADVRHAVVTSIGWIVGVISDRDLGGRDGGKLRKGRSVEDLMRTTVITVPPEMSVAKAALLARKRRIGCLPVFDGARLVGIVTRGDLLAALAGRRRERHRVAVPNREMSP